MNNLNIFLAVLIINKNITTEELLLLEDKLSNEEVPKTVFGVITQIEEIIGRKLYE